MFRIKCCRKCKHCGLDLKALEIVHLLIDKCYLHKHTISHPWVNRCKDWEEDND